MWSPWVTCGRSAQGERRRPSVCSPSVPILADACCCGLTRRTGAARFVCGRPGGRGGRAAAGGVTMSGYGGPGAPPDPPRRYDPAGAGPAGPPSPAMRTRLDRGGCVSVSAVHADVNVHRPSAYWDYDMMSVPWGFVSQRLSSSVCAGGGGGVGGSRAAGGSTGGYRCYNSALSCNGRLLLGVRR